MAIRTLGISQVFALLAKVHLCLGFIFHVKTDQAQVIYDLIIQCEVGTNLLEYCDF
jgi:hypothetical protein